MAPELPPSSFVNGLGIAHLERFWAKTDAKKKKLLPQNAYLEEWMLDHALLNALGIGLEPTLEFLFCDATDYRSFEKWILEKTGGPDPEKINAFNQIFFSENKKAAVSSSEKLLSEDDHRFFREHGYLVIPGAVTEEESRLAQEAVWEFLGFDKNDPASWYRKHKDQKGIMVQLFHHPALEATRRSEKIRRVFAELLDNENLFVTTDRVSFNPPETETYQFQGPDLHWDVSIVQPVPFALQGLLYLTDTKANQGAFTLVPGFRQKFPDWLASLPEGANPRVAILGTTEAKPIAANRGDFIVWDQALPHGSSPNTADFPRIVQYITWQEMNEEMHLEWK